MPFVFFDLDDTLVDRGRAFPECVSRFCRLFSLGEDVAAWLLREMYVRAYRADFSRLREQFALPEPAEELWRGYCEAMAEAVMCSPETLDGLTRLRAAGWPLAVVTNGAGDIQRAKLRRTGLLPFVDAVCISEEVGLRKPAGGIFEAAGQLLGLGALTGGWMVGDSLQNDVHGGRAAGLRTVWIGGPPGTDEADHGAGTVAEAVELILATDGGADV
ncbi:HAD family hydrolase [Streptomyces bauhiniae]|uniref:HAD family hydrolase n=1 Tax=Streptomyces bauhiniae TaxID=2340725 RepID=UPI00142F17EE|nr:HAD family hydrolase [Streptomyces bauhiniae]